MSVDRRITARFDDGTDPARSFLLIEPVSDMRAETIDDVAPVVSEAEAAARAGCWVAGYVAYEAAPAFDRSLRVRRDRCGPLARFIAFRERVPAPTLPAIPMGAPYSAGPWTPDISAHQHSVAVARVRHLIGDGITYQVNVTTRLRGRVGEPALLYAQMLVAQRSRYGACIQDPDRVIVSASPELFFTIDGDQIRTRPMKGTAPRGRWPEEDRNAAETLRTSAKERAENVMIVDLMRSDLGRIATHRTVAVADLFALEPYPTVWQMTSTVTATVRAGTTLLDVFTALFPSGSVTGAPKVTAMAAIAELELEPRGVYCGAIGYIEPGTVLRSRFSVAIRTAVIERDTACATYGAGGGITWSSDAGAEWSELLAKTEVLDPGANVGGLVETMRGRADGTIVNRERHLERLALSADALGIPIACEEVEAALDAEARCGRIRLVVESNGRVSVSVTPLGAPPAGPVRLGILPRAVSSRDRMLFHKGADRARYDRWRAARPTVDDVILGNERDEVTETTIANLVVGRDGRWWTPPLASGLLPGVARGRLLEAGVVAERVLRIEDLAGASLAVVSSLRGWRPAVLAGDAFGDGGQE
ncbi:MAG: aminodeoxychorismate synthase component I [Acidimicrobiales bacterium]